MDRRIWTAWVGSIGSALLLGSCSATPQGDDAVASQEWDLKHGGVGDDGCPRHAHKIVGTAGESEASSLRCPRIAAIADTASLAEAYGKPEWMPAAA